MNWLILFLATFSPTQLEAFNLVGTAGTPDELAAYVQTELILSLGVPAVPEYEEIGFDRIDDEGNVAAVILGNRTIRIPVEAFDGRANIWYGEGFSRFSDINKPRYIAITRGRTGEITAAVIHMNAL